MADEDETFVSIESVNTDEGVRYVVRVHRVVTIEELRVVSDGLMQAASQFEVVAKADEDMRNIVIGQRKRRG